MTKPSYDTTSWRPKSKHFRSKSAAAVIAVAVIFAVAGLWYAHGQASQLIKAGDSATDPKQAILNYRLASLIDPRNYSLYQKQADIYIKLGQPDGAIRLLQHMPLRDSGFQIVQVQFRSHQYKAALDTANAVLDIKTLPDVMIMKSRILLEQGKTQEALDAAKNATSYAVGSTDAERQLRLCQALKDRKTMTTLALAKGLYSDGMLNAAEKLLVRETVASSEYYILLNQVELVLAQWEPSRLAYAKQAGEQGIAFDPANLELHKLLRNTYVLQGDKAGEARETEMINRLEQGSI